MAGFRGIAGILIGMAALGAALATPASAQSDLEAEITVWSWDVGATALKAVVPAFNQDYPGIEVTVEDLGNQPVYDRGLAGCSAGGINMPDVYSIENHEAEVFWSRFPDCFWDLKALDPEEADLLATFPKFKLAELTIGDKIYAMPWDSGPVVVFYRRDLYEAAGVDPAEIETWDDFIAAGKTVQAKAGGEVKFLSTFGGGASMTWFRMLANTTWFRMLANQAGCAYFDEAGETVTINQPGCVQALETVKKIDDAGLFLEADWNETLQAIKANLLASVVLGGWYEGSIRGNAPEQEGKWGVYRMPAFTAGGSRSAYLSGSALAIPASSKNPRAALAFVNFALARVDSQITQLKASGLVPTLPEAIHDPYIQEPQPYWSGQKIWEVVLSTLPEIKPERGTQYFAEAHNIADGILVQYMRGGSQSAQEALDEAAEQISGATGLPIAP